MCWESLVFPTLLNQLSLESDYGCVASGNASFQSWGNLRWIDPLKYFTTSKRDASDQLSGPMGIARNIEMVSCPPPCSSSGGHPVAPARSFGKYRIIRSPKAIGYDLMFLEKQKQGFLCGKEASSALQSTELLTGCS